MGTNFYIRKKINQQQKDMLCRMIQNEQWDEFEQNLPEAIHLGKRSSGWKFLWDAHEFTYFKPNKKSLIEFLKSGNIEDEYGHKFTFDEFWNEELDGFLDQGWDLTDYYAENHSIYKHYEPDYIRYKFQQKYNVNVNAYGEFYIDGLRFATSENFA